MPSKNSEKNKDAMKELEKVISPILVINNSSLKPYVELFEYHPENVYQQPLGTLIGFFEVKEYSDNSAYIVNFLTSVLKKEYYINPKRSIEESFDAALHKANLALSELAKHGNVEWLGKLNASICVLEKNGAHFSVAGNARMFLWRSNTLTDISEGLASEESVLHPLKTFINISSGRLEKNDRLLITSDDLFQIMTQNELTKNFQRLEKEKFVQFLKTACSNQLEMIASVVVEIPDEKQIKKATIASTKKQGHENVFSETAFGKPAKDEINEEKNPQPHLHDDEITDYTDKKTGHIYVQGENHGVEETGQAIIYLEMAKEKISSGWYHAKNITKRRTLLYKKSLKRFLKEYKQKRELAKAERLEQKRLQEELQMEQEKELTKILEQQKQEAEKRRREEEAKERERIKLEEEQAKFSPKTDIPEKILSDISPGDQSIPDAQPEELSFAEKLARAKQFQAPKIETEQINADEVVHIHYSNISSPQDSNKEKIKLLAQKLSVSSLEFFKNFPEFISQSIKALKEKIDYKRSESLDNDFSKSDKFKILPKLKTIKTTYGKLNLKQKIGTIFALVLVFIIPIFIARWLDKPTQAPIAAPQRLPDPSEIYTNEKNIHLAVSHNIVSQDSSIIMVLVTNSGNVAIAKNSVIMPIGSSAKSYPLPSDAGNAVRATYMHDLNMILILTDKGSVISFSPNVQKYSSNNINLAGVSATSLIGTYLTYFYVLDQQSNQIYRFPRADGGFAEKTTWLKDNASLSQSSDMTIDDNIYVVQENKVLKFFKGKTSATNLEASNTPVSFSLIYTITDSPSLYVVDNKNTRLVQYDKATGSISAQYYDPILKDSSSLSVDEQNKVAYIVTSSGLISISLQ